MRCSLRLWLLSSTPTHPSTPSICFFLSLSGLRYEHHGFTDQCAAFDGSSASALGGMMLKVGVTQTQFFPLTIQACRGCMSPNHKHAADALGLHVLVS